MMTFESYLEYFKGILEDETKEAPYDTEEFMGYATLNWARINRWLKNGVISEEIKETISKIKKPQNWLIITEAWCGDAAQIMPFIYKISQLNSLISLEIELRDKEPFSINNYLTEGKKFIPVFVIRDENGKDLAVWGPRPKEATALFNRKKEEGLDFEALKTELQKWYNADKGKKLQAELNVALVHTL